MEGTKRWTTERRSRVEKGDRRAGINKPQLFCSIPRVYCSRGHVQILKGLNGGLLANEAWVIPLRVH